jgi:hypothetical protein
LIGLGTRARSFRIARRNMRSPANCTDPNLPAMAQPIDWTERRRPAFFRPPLVSGTPATGNKAPPRPKRPNNYTQDLAEHLAAQADEF